MTQNFHAVFEQSGEWWVATAVEIPGAFSQGRTIDEARENLLDAIRELLLARRELVEADIVNKVGVIREELTLELD
jgi:predicted RNase H-like HicB family nuclease